MPNIAIIANSRSGKGVWSAWEKSVRQRPRFRVFLLGDMPLRDLIETAASNGCETIAAAGGDGTVSAVADAIMRSGKRLKLGVLPIGTLNHFAKDLRIPLMPEAALDLLEKGAARDIDIARVNDRYFINNSSIGLYPYLVRARDDLAARGVHKWTAFAYAFFMICMRRFSFAADLGQGAVRKKTAAVFVGNNKYHWEGASIGGRERLDQGVLFVGVLKSIRVFGVLWLLLKSLAGRASRDSNLNVTGLSECLISGPRKTILVAYDGEIERMQMPLRYTIYPKALRVVAPTI